MDGVDEQAADTSTTRTESQRTTQSVPESNRKMPFSPTCRYRRSEIWAGSPGNSRICAVTWCRVTVDWRISEVSKFVLVLTLAGLIPGCTRNCTDMVGIYPPDVVVMIGLESVEVPYAAWGCSGYDLDAADSVPSIPAVSQLTVEVSLREESTVDLRVDNESVPVDPAPLQGDNAWTLDLPPEAESVSIRICSEEDACAVYVAELQL